MGFFNNKEDERFGFTLTVTPRSAGDFGCARIGGMYRDIETCIRDANEITEAIERHVDGVDSVDFVINDAFADYGDITSWWYESLKRTIAKEKECKEWEVKWEDIKEAMPKPEPSHEDLKSQLKRTVELLKREDWTKEEIIEDIEELLNE